MLRSLPALALALLLAACGGATEPADAEARRIADGTIDVRPVPGLEYHRSYSGVGDRRRLVVRDEQAWSALWAELVSNVQPAPAVPAVDFSRDMVLFVSMGARPSGGYAIELADVGADASGVYATVVETSPSDRCIVTAALTQPVAAVIVPRDDRAVRFTERTAVHHCD